MDKLSQKNIDQYLEGRELDQVKKDKVLAAITPMVYNRNQNIIKFEGESDEVKKKQFARSVEEYDELIEEKIKEVLNGKSVESYDF